MRKNTKVVAPLLLLAACAAFFCFVPTASAAGDCQVEARTPAVPPSPFEGVCDYLAGRDGVVEAAIFDNQSGETWVLGNGDDTQYTASIVKVNVLARWLNGYQRKGVKIPDGIPYSIRYLMGRMIDNSDNAATTGLFHFGGGCSTLTKFNLLIPLDNTKVGCESANYYGWGNTQTTAEDQLDLMKVYVYGATQAPVTGAERKARRNCRGLKDKSRRRACHRKVTRKTKRLARTPILGAEARAYGNSLMQQVEPDQRFGLTCGPWGEVCNAPNWADPDPAVTVSLKNGWKTLPTCTDPIPQCPWQVNSTGWVRGKGRDYAMSILTTRDPVGTGDTFGFNYGIETIQGISKQVWTNLDE